MKITIGINEDFHLLHTYKHTYVRTYIHTYILTDINTIHTYIHTCIDIYVHTYKHTCMHDHYRLLSCKARMKIKKGVSEDFHLLSQELQTMSAVKVPR
jgi:hypothetical protein